MSNQHLVVGGNGATKVFITDDYKGVFDQLEAQASTKGGYWSQRAIHQMRSLTSGHWKENVFISESPSAVPGTEFEMVCPGCVVKITKQSSGNYLIWGMELSDEYGDLDTSPDVKAVKPGLYRASQALESGTWEAEYIASGVIPSEQIQSPENTIVSITSFDGKNKTLSVEVAEAIKQSQLNPGGAAVERKGFYFHNLPREGGLGLRQRLDATARKAAYKKNLKEAVPQLAYLMSDVASQDSKNFRWISVHHGSETMLETMQVLKRSGVRFNEMEHELCFYRPRSSPHMLEQMGKELGMTVDRKATTVNYAHPKELYTRLAGFSGIKAAWNRRHDKGNTMLKVGSDIASEVSSVATAGKSGLVGVAGAGTLVGAPALQLAMEGATVKGLVTGLAASGGSMSMMLGVGFALMAAYPVGKSMVKTHLPKVDNYFKRHF